MDLLFQKMLRRVGKGFYYRYIGAVRKAISEDSLASLIRRVSAERNDIITVEFRIRAMASAVRQGYAR